MKTCDEGISIPRSPRATMTPSVTARISSKLTTPCSFSILTMILMPAPSGPRTSRIVRTSWAERMKEAKTMSTPFLTPNWRSFLSFSDRAGRSTAVLGRLTPLREQSEPLLTAWTLSRSPSMARTFSERTPSST